MAVSNDPNQMFQGPIPGASLTKTPGGHPWQSSPPQFHEEDDALDYMWNTALKDPKTLVKIGVFLKGGLAITEIVNTFLFTGIAGNKWTPDLALMMYQEVAWMIEAIARTQGIKYTFKRVDPEYAAFLLKYKDYIQSPDDSPVEKVANKIFDGLPVPTKG